MDIKVAPEYQEWFAQQDADAQAQVVRYVGLLQEFGTALRRPYSAYLEDGILELRPTAKALKFAYSTRLKTARCFSSGEPRAAQTKGDFIVSTQRKHKKSGKHTVSQTLPLKPGSENETYPTLDVPAMLAKYAPGVDMPAEIAKAELRMRAYDLAMLRKACHVTQVQLAKRLGIKQASVSGIENAQAKSLDGIKRYAKALDLDVRVGFYRKGELFTVWSDEESSGIR